jgi:hypothetical protein
LQVENNAVFFHVGAMNHLLIHRKCRCHFLWLIPHNLDGVMHLTNRSVLNAVLFLYFWVIQLDIFELLLAVSHQRVY